MRKLFIGALTGVVFLAVAAVAFALSNNTVNYSSTVKYTGKARKVPINTQYKSVLDIGTTDNTQPNSAPETDVFFAKQLVNNGTSFPSCKPSEIDGKATVPAKCSKARIGVGTAHAKVGNAAGKPPAFERDLTVTIYNGNKGKQLLIVVNSKPGDSPQVTNRVIPGNITKQSGKFGQKIAFLVPKDLQSQANGAIQLALTQFSINVPKTKTVTKRVSGVKRKVSYLQTKNCPKSKKLPVQATVHFNKDDGSPGGQVATDASTMACK